MEVFRGFFDEKLRANASEFFDVAFDPAIAWRNVEKLNPLAEAEAFFDNGAGAFTERRLEFSFARIGSGKKVDRLFAVVRDVTERAALAEEIEKARSENREEMEMLQRLLHVDPRELPDFFKSLKEEAEAINDELRSGEANPGEHLDAMFRHSHAIKGDSQLLSLDFLAERAESLEQRIQELRGRENLSPGDFLPLTIACSALLDTVEKLGVIINKWLKLSDTVRPVRGGAPGRGAAMREALGEMAKRLAEQYGKDVELEMEPAGFESYVRSPGKLKALRDILVQFVRNSVYHGIETPELRRRRGKPPAGRIRIEGRAEGEQLTILYRDDGTGLDGERIVNKAVVQGLLDGEKARNLSEGEKIRYIFHPGFSTAEHPDSVAGKGMGLSLVSARVRELGGKLSLKSRRGSYSEFILVFPLGSLSGDEAPAARAG
jgi:signal transduction histidine kinase